MLRETFVDRRRYPHVGSGNILSQSLAEWPVDGGSVFGMAVHRGFCNIFSDNTSKMPLWMPFPYHERHGVGENHEAAQDVSDARSQAVRLLFPLPARKVVKRGETGSSIGELHPVGHGPRVTGRRYCCTAAHHAKTGMLLPVRAREHLMTGVEVSHLSIPPGGTSRGGRGVRRTGCR